MLARAKDLPDIFEVAKEAVRAKLGLSRAGLMLGLADLGGDMHSFVGGMYPIASNVIIMNKRPLAMIKGTSQELYSPYAFHILLHEYIHAIGIIDEAETRRLTFEISESLFGMKHLVTKLAEDISQFLPYLSYPGPSPMPSEMQLELVTGFDRSSVNYIS